MQTAMKSHIQWLYDNQLELNIPIEVIEDAEDRLEMEKQQIIDAHLIGLITSLETEATKKATEYYNETYGSKGSDATSSQTEISYEKPMRFHCVPKEISDEEINKEAKRLYDDSDKEYYAFFMGAMFYREQLKSR